MRAKLSIGRLPLSVALPSGGTPQRSGIGGALFRLQIYTIILKLPNFMVKNLYITKGYKWHSHLWLFTTSKMWNEAGEVSR